MIRGEVVGSVASVFESQDELVACSSAEQLQKCREGSTALLYTENLWFLTRQREGCGLLAALLLSVFLMVP